MNSIISLLAGISALVVTVHALNLAATINIKTWVGHRIEFMFIAAAETAIFAGAIWVAAEGELNGKLLLIGVGILLFLKETRYGYR